MFSFLYYNVHLFVGAFTLKHLTIIVILTIVLLYLVNKSVVKNFANATHICNVMLMLSINCNAIGIIA